MTPEDWVIFENTHEAIIEQDVFDTVQKLRENKRRPTKRQDEIPLFSGLLYCADCGKKLYFTRGKGVSKSQENYFCSSYRRRTTDCTIHSIRSVMLEEIVLEDIKRMMKYVTEYEEEFISNIIEKSEKKHRQEILTLEHEIHSMAVRYSELDIIFKRLYEDSISGDLTKERFSKLSFEYEKEQEQLWDWGYG